MLHVRKTIRQRYPSKGERIIGSLLFLSITGLLTGAVLLFMQ